MTIFGKKLKDACVTFYACREASGIPTQMVSNWAAGRCKPQISERFIKLMRWLQVEKGVNIKMEDFTKEEAENGNL
jgi:hypothetical protein